MKKNYQQPQIEVLKARVEQGFAGSGHSCHCDCHCKSEKDDSDQDYFKYSFA